MLATPHNHPIAKNRELDSATYLGSDVNDIKTLQVSILHPSARPVDNVITPPPAGERKLSQAFLSEIGRKESVVPGTPLQVGDRIQGFELVEELGQGAFAQVFLAKQESLAHRPVALKITLRPTREAERLARLQHTHIVPVYSIHDAAPVQVICMPYLGRRTIADLIRGFRADNPSQGQAYRKTAGTRPARTTAFADIQSTAKSSSSSGAFPRPLNLAIGETLPKLIGDPHAVLQVLAQLASGLAHAHERGILHLDLKPANVLLADTGEPMLLDFNLSFDAANPDRELIGGTVPYMSTEQLRDLKTRGKGKVDARTDLYSLGVMAFEMLTGTVPFPASFLADIEGLIAARKKGPPSIRALNPAVTPAVESIVRKLLAPDPNDRYQSAAEFQIDVERQLNHQPLVHARETSIRERLRKWRRRNPRVPGRVLVASLLGLAVALGGIAYSRSEAFANSRAIERFAGSRVNLDRVRLDLIISSNQQERKRGVEQATALLQSYGLPDDLNWQKRDDVRRLSERDRTTLAFDLGELLLLLAQTNWKEAEAKSDVERRETAEVLLKLTDAARTCYPAGSTPELLDHQAAQFARILGKQEEPHSPRDANRQPNAREYFLDASAKIAARRYGAATDLLRKAIEDQPGHAAAHFCLAYCLQQNREDSRAIERYEAARVLMPNDPRPFFQCGVINGQRREYELAETDFTRAIALDPENTLAYRNRGIARLRLKKFKQAEEDLTAALSFGAPAIQIHLMRADVRCQLGDAEGAKEDRELAANLAPKLEGDYLIRGLYRMNTDPNAALADFQAASRLNPFSASALENQIAVLADKLKTPDLVEALAIATKGAEQFPENVQLHLNRALLLARMGRREEAHQAIEHTRLKSDNADVSYCAACVYSLTSVKNPEDSDKAFEMLRKSIRDKHRGCLDQEKDLDPIRKRDEFSKIVQAAKTLNK